MCGYSFYHQYVAPNRVKRVEGIPQARGSAVHEVYERITERFCSSEAPVFNKKEVLGWVTEAVNRYPAAYAEIGPIIEMAEKYINRPPKVLTQDAQIELKLAVKSQVMKGWEDSAGNKYLSRPKLGPIEVKGEWVEPAPAKECTWLDFVECDYDDPEAFARGKADIMMISDDTTTALVYDHKTQPNVEDADTFQLGFYAWIIWKMYPFLSQIQTVLHFARYGKYSEPYIWTTEDLQKIEDEILTRVAIIESRESWEATPNKMCQYCPFLHNCPAMSEFVETDSEGRIRSRTNSISILGDVNKAVRLAGALNVYEELVKNIKVELKEHVSNYGPIAIPGKIYEFKDKEEIHWDKVNKKYRAETYAIFEKYGVDPKAFMSFNQTASKSIWMTENQKLVQELSDLFPRKVTTEFKGYKA